MTTDAKTWLNELLIPSDDDFAGRRHWGFTIYRTGYGPSSDQQWQRLLETIKAGAHEGAFEAIESEKEDPEDDPEFQELWSLFRLDARSDPAASIVKCVDVDYRAEDHIPRNPGLGGQRYYGWMPMKAGCVADFWVELGLAEMSEIAPPTIGGNHLVIWEAGQL